MGEAAPQHDSAALGVEHALISAFRVSTVATAYIPGDIPSLLRHAYSRHFNKVMPVERDAETTSASASSAELESLQTMLSRIPPLKPTAQALLDRARSILADGPPLSMNVELAEGQELPVALHTLLQGTLWAVMIASADPDLEDRVLEEARVKWPDENAIHGKIRNALAPEAKCLWFLCRKFFFTLNVAEKDGESYKWTDYERFYHHRMYMGRLFMLYTRHHTALTRATMPRALEVYSNYITYVARTPKGLWGWGNSFEGQLGFQSEFSDPARLTFPACPKVAELEASLPAWEKHSMVTAVSMKHGQAFILTPAGTIMAGSDAELFVGPVEEENWCRFKPVSVQTGFVPAHIMHDSAVILTMGDRQVISGWNNYGQLGLGHENEMTGFEELSFRRRQLLFAGEVPKPIAQSGLLPGYYGNEECVTATPLRFPGRVKGFYCDRLALIWVTDGHSHLRDDNDSYRVRLESTALGVRSVDDGVAYSFRDNFGQWFRVTGVSSGVAKLVECEAPDDCDIFTILPVDLDPWESGA
ncbi:hypothetical protein J8273_5178 [Carpediemonas membranifera]|uniref:Uncharacterized protein n=1 Tax=Carpediemonas membranifera TaxID=201153 RepID=A0A8J6BW89_9EUKA|nr:hypothetical protein J8273_5178 [Carpediemonas membranifera]|eukprot:KAG9392196.1 hypothetical protein J8273_5178 [Carpediemonas membranifera]